MLGGLLMEGHDLYPDNGRKDDAIVITREESLDLQEDICRSRDLSFHLVLSEKQKYENKNKMKMQRFRTSSSSTLRRCICVGSSLDRQIQNTFFFNFVQI